MEAGEHLVGFVYAERAVTGVFANIVRAVVRSLFRNPKFRRTLNDIVAHCVAAAIIWGASKAAAIVESIDRLTSRVAGVERSLSTVVETVETVANDNRVLASEIENLKTRLPTKGTK